MGLWLPLPRFQRMPRHRAREVILVKPLGKGLLKPWGPTALPGECVESGPHPTGSRRQNFCPVGLGVRASSQRTLLRLTVFCPTGFWSCSGPVTPFFFATILLPFGMGVSILGLFHGWILEAQNLFDFTGSLRGKNLLQDKSYLQSHP